MVITKLIKIFQLEIAAAQIAMILMAVALAEKETPLISAEMVKTHILIEEQTLWATNH